MISCARIDRTMLPFRVYVYVSFDRISVRQVDRPPIVRIPTRSIDPRRTRKSKLNLTLHITTYAK